jgi:hypothetical protein
MLQDDVLAADVAQVPEALHEGSKWYPFFLGVACVPQDSDLRDLPPVLGLG